MMLLSMDDLILVQQKFIFKNCYMYSKQKLLIPLEPSFSSPLQRPVMSGHYSLTLGKIKEEKSPFIAS